MTVQEADDRSECERRRIEYFRIYREYVQHEDGLINSRLLWNINIQGFLFATYGLSVQKLVSVPEATVQAQALRWLIVLLPVLGSLIALVSWIGVVAAKNAIETLVEQWRATETALPALGGPALPNLTGGARGRKHGAGHIAPKVFPWLFVGAWGCLLATYLLHVHLF